MALRLQNCGDILETKGSCAVCHCPNGDSCVAGEEEVPLRGSVCQCSSRTAPGLIVTSAKALSEAAAKLRLSTILTMPEGRLLARYFEALEV